MNSRTLQSANIKDLTQQLESVFSEQFKPTLAIVFCSPSYDLSALSQLFKSHQIQLIGCSTAGEIVNDDLVHDSIVSMLLDIPYHHFQIVSTVFAEENELAVSHRLGRSMSEIFDDPAIIIFASGLLRDAEQIIDGLKDCLNPATPIYGGLAGDNLKFERNVCFTIDAIIEDGVVGLVIDQDHIKIHGQAVSGWMGLGKRNKITRAVGNIIYEIDYKPALDVFITYFGKIQKRYDGKDTYYLPGQHPLEIANDNGAKSLRSIISYDETDKTLILAGGVKTGDMFRFCNCPSFEEVEQTVNEFKQFSEMTPDIDAAILVSCAARFTAFGPMLNDEIKGIYDQWNAPMVGFLSYGEFGNRLDDGFDFHNSTCALIGLKTVEV